MIIYITYTHVCDYIYMTRLGSFMGDNAIDYVAKNLETKMENFTLSCWLEESRKLPKEYRLLLFLVLASQNLKVGPYC